MVNRTQRKQMIADVISDRIRSAAYRAWYISTLNTGKLTGTVYSRRGKR